MKTFDLSLYLVLDPDLCSKVGMVETARLAAEGGVTMIQLRDKGADTAALIGMGKSLQAALVSTGIPLIINDNVEAAIALGAAGLHVGQSDLSARESRQRIGSDMILGVSVETVELARNIDPEIVDYVGIGPVFATSTKPDHMQPIGFDGLSRIVAASPVPAVAIGGLKQGHVDNVFAAGAKGLAVVSAICGTTDPKMASSNLCREIRRALQ